MPSLPKSYTLQGHLHGTNKQLFLAGFQGFNDEFDRNIFIQQIIVSNLSSSYSYITCELTKSFNAFGDPSYEETWTVLINYNKLNPKEVRYYDFTVKDSNLSGIALNTPNTMLFVATGEVNIFINGYARKA